VAFTQEVVKIIKSNLVIDWAEKEDVQREIRKEIKRLLRNEGCPKEKRESLTLEILNLARNQYGVSQS
jgi:type I restriction enzyme R subunit